jgi:hypothetical protein
LHLITLNDTHTHTVRGTPLDEGSAHRRDLYMTTHKIHKRRTFMSPAGIEVAIPASERPQTHVLDRAATGIDNFCCPAGELTLAVGRLLNQALFILTAISLALLVLYVTFQTLDLPCPYSGINNLVNCQQYSYIIRRYRYMHIFL